MGMPPWSSGDTHNRARQGLTLPQRQVAGVAAAGAGALEEEPPDLVSSPPFPARAFLILSRTGFGKKSTRSPRMASRAPAMASPTRTALKSSRVKFHGWRKHLPVVTLTHVA